MSAQGITLIFPDGDGDFELSVLALVTDYCVELVMRDGTTVNVSITDHDRDDEGFITILGDLLDDEYGPTGEDWEGRWMDVATVTIY